MGFVRPPLLFRAEGGFEIISSILFEQFKRKIDFFFVGIRGTKRDKRANVTVSEKMESAQSREHLLRK